MLRLRVFSLELKTICNIFEKALFFFIPPLYVLINQDLQNSADKENNVKKQSLKERDSEKEKFT